MPVSEGATSYPADSGTDKGVGVFDGTNFYFFRADNATAKNLKVALYDASGNALLVSANPGVVNLTQVNGVALLAGAGNTGTGSPRVTIATDQAAYSVNATPVAPATGTVIGNVGGIQTAITLTPTVSTTPAYTAGDAVGGKLTLSSAVRLSGGGGVIQSIVVADKGKQSAATDIVFFNADPSGTTFTDNGALTIADADLLKIIGHVSVAATDYASFVDNSVATKYGLGLAFKASGSTSLYAVLIARGTPTYASTSDVQVIVGILQD